jgi:hypothetical protein
VKDQHIYRDAVLEGWNGLHPLCALTGRVIQDSDYTVWFPHFITDNQDPFWRYNERSMLREAFDEWEQKKTFLARWNESVHTHVVPQVDVLVSLVDYLVWLAESPPTIVLSFLAHGFSLSIRRKEWRRFEVFLLEPCERSETFYLSDKWQVSVRAEGDKIRIAWEPHPTLKEGRRDRVLLDQSEWELLKKVVRDVGRLLSRMKR